MQEVKAAKKIEKCERAQKSCRDHSLELIQKRPNWLLIFSFLTSVKKNPRISGIAFDEFLGSSNLKSIFRFAL